MDAERQEKRLRWMVLCCLALAALELTALYQFNYGSWTWDWVVHTAPAGILVLAVGVLFLGAANGLTWKLASPVGARDLRTYWIYCGVLMLLCLMQSDLDSSLHMLFVIVSMFTTPLGVVGAALGALPGGARYTLCYGVLLVLSAAECVYHGWLLRRYQAQRQKITGDGA